MADTKPLGPFKLVTVNNAPERAKRLVGRVVENVKDKYTIDYVANAESPEQVREVVTREKPDVLVSMQFHSLSLSFFVHVLLSHCISSR